MSLNEADTRAQLIDPKLKAVGRPSHCPRRDGRWKKGFSVRLRVRMSSLGQERLSEAILS